MNETASSYQKTSGHDLEYAANVSDSPAIEVARLSFSEFVSLGTDEISRRDVPVVIDLPELLTEWISIERIRSLLGESNAALFCKSKDITKGDRSKVTKIRLNDFFDEKVYNDPDDPNWYRIVTNLCNRPDDITRLLGHDFRDLFQYEKRFNSANIWINYKGQFGRSHFDEFENYNLALAGSKRFLLLEPGFWNYYTRSVLRGFGHHSRVANFDEADLSLFPRLGKAFATRRDIILNPGQMLYIPLGWWHQVHPLGHLNVNINFWLKSPKILSRPYVLVDALYKMAFRKLAGLYDYQPEKINR